MRAKTVLLIIVPLTLLVLAVALSSLFDSRKEPGFVDEKSGARNNPVSHDNTDIRRIEEASSIGELRVLADEFLTRKATAPGGGSLMEALLDRWIELDMASALDFLAEPAEAGIRGGFLEYALVEAGYLDFRRAVDWINPRPEPLRSDLLGLLYEGIGRDNPEYALSFADLLHEGETKDRLLRVLLEQWGERDTGAALAWMSAQVLSEAFNDLKASLLSRLMAQDPQEAGAFIRNMPPAHEKNTLARNYADMLARTDIQGAAAWARSLDDPYAHALALTAVYEVWYQKEPDKSVIMEQVLAESDGDLRDRLINEIALDIANNDPAELARMVDRLPQSAQPDVAEKAVRFWKDRDPQGVMQWVDGLNAGPVRDRVSRVMVEHLLLSSDKTAAMSLASTIQEASMRYESAKNAAAYLFQRNPAEAEQMLEEISFLSESEKESINRYLRQNYR